MATRRVYVTSRAGRFIPGLGSRRYGEFFDVEADQAAELLALPGLSETDPAAPEKRTSRRRPADTGDMNDAE